MIADAMHNLPHLLAAESLPDSSVLIREVTLAKETFLAEKI
ncbi:hypothetical protein ASAP_2994 [Asaia bogorensis]|uniref:Uncharacterized protein n=2 Tax=Acetobacteraceae TaxID=433 RepID=A0A060QIN8_9PROT|nr:hypothetical protein ASAP_2994 [Asaia bogorensis]